MSRKSAGRQSDQVESQVELSQGGPAIGQGAARKQQSLLLNRRQRLQGQLHRWPAFYLDDAEPAAASRQQIDLALARAKSEAKDLVTLNHQPQRRDDFRRAAVLAALTAAFASRFGARVPHARP